MSKDYEYAECQHCGHLDTNRYIGMQCPICKKSIMESRNSNNSNDNYFEEEDIESLDYLEEEDEEDDYNDDY